MLCRHTAAGSALRAHHERHAAVSAGHQPELGGLVDQHVHAEHGEVDVKNFNDRPCTRDGSTDADADHACFGNWRIADPLRAIFRQQPFGDLVGAAAFSNAFADDEDRLVAGHFLVDRFPKRIAVHDFSGHLLISLNRAQ